VKCAGCGTVFPHATPDDKPGVKQLTESTQWVTCPKCKQTTKVVR
jgi:rubredoxin